MDDVTLKALKESIQHWRENAAAKNIEDASVSSENCALCNLFHPEFGGDDCNSCPVAKRTGEMYCGGTPYHEADRAFLLWGLWNSGEVGAERFRNKARKMVVFLESLLPEEAT